LNNLVHCLEMLHISHQNTFRIFGLGYHHCGSVAPPINKRSIICSIRINRKNRSNQTHDQHCTGNEMIPSKSSNQHCWQASIEARVSLQRY
jgi:hypothetical protein